MDENNSKSLKEIYFEQFMGKMDAVSTTIPDMVKIITGTLDNIMSLTDAMKDFAEKHSDVDGAEELKDISEVYGLNSSIMFNAKEVIALILDIDSVYKEYEKSLQD
jgi:hypothetical protein